MLKGGTMAMVFVTYIIFGALMPLAVKFFRTLDPVVKLEELKISEEVDNSHKSEKEDMNCNYTIDFSHPNFIKTYIIL